MNTAPCPAPHPDSAAEAVLDTNVLLDWLVFRHPGLLDLGALLAADGLHWIQTAAMRQELGYVLTPTLLQRWSASLEQVQATINAHVRQVEAPEPLQPPQRLRCADHDDQIFIDLALSRRSRWLLTRDRALLKLARRAAAHGVTVCTPESWLARRALADADHTGDAA